MVLLEGTNGDQVARTGWGAVLRYWEPAMDLLLARDVEVILGTTRARGPLQESAEKRGIPTFALETRSAVTYSAAILSLRRLLRRHRVDVIHANETIQAAIGGLASRLDHRARCVFHRHHVTAPGNQRLLNHIASRTAHHTMAISEAVATAARSRDSVDPRRVCVALNGLQPMRGVESHEIAEIRAELEIPPESPVIAVIGRLRPEKGHRYLIDALPAINSRLQKAVHLVVVGSGPEEEQLRLAAKDPRVHLVGHKDDVAPWQQLADVLVIPSLSEPFGLVAIEAMAAGRPIVASRVGGLKEIISSEDVGVLVTPGSAVELAGAITDLIKDRERAASMGAAGKRLAATRFSHETMVDSWLDCYRKAMTLR